MALTCKRLFYGKYTWFPWGGNKMETKEELFNTIIVNVAAGPTHIYSALDDYFDPHEIDAGAGTVQRYGVINTLPPILQINISRVMYDRVKGAQFKIEHHLQLEDILYLDRYIESPDPDLLARRKQSWELKRQLAQLKARRAKLSSSYISIDTTSALKAASMFTNGVLLQNNELPFPTTPRSDSTTTTPIPDDLAGNIPGSLLHRAFNTRQQISSIDAEIAALEHQIRILFADLNRVAYRLHAVFIHRGTAAGGHYWVYIRDFMSDVWRCYNDSNVTLVEDPSRTIFAEDVPGQSGLHPATPNLLVYVREDSAQRLVRSVFRRLAGAAIAGPTVEMREVTAEMSDVKPQEERGDSGMLDVELVSVGAQGNGESVRVPVVMDQTGGQDEDMDVLNGVDADENQPTK
jgi:ubiquitin carboxyl-terminal hydrolase 25